jgi:hypothetical protein
MESDLLPAQFAASGTGSVTGVVPSQGDFYVGREYTLTWVAETDHTTPSTNAITTSGTFQGNYVYTGGATCDSYPADETVDGTAGEDWFVSTVRTESTTELVFTMYASVNSGAADAGFGLMTDAGTPTWSDLVTRVRFAENGTIEVRDSIGGTYNCDDGLGDTTCPPYIADAVYKFVFDVDILAGTYDLDVHDPCDGTADRLAEDRRLTSPVSSLDRYGAWESFSDTLSIVDDSSEGSWVIPGCTPDTCTPGTPPLECGTPDDGCGTPLACGDTCGGGETCYPQGTCCTIEADTTTCGTNDCGIKVNNCGENVDCDVVRGTCDSRVSGEVCNGGVCAAEPAEGGPYVHVVPADVGLSIGLGVTGPVPTVACSFPNPITSNGTTVENCIWNAGCIFIQANNVTFRNVNVNRNNYSGCHHGFWVEGADNFLFTNGKMDGNSDKAFFLYGSVTNFTVEKSEISGFQDTVFAGNPGCGSPGGGCGHGDILIDRNYIHDLDGFSYTSDPHFDVLQNGAWGPNGVWTISGNYMDANIGRYDHLSGVFFGGDGGETLLIENNYMFPWGNYGPRWYGPGVDFVMRNNVYDVIHKSLLGSDPYVVYAVFYASSDSNGTYECNRYSDGDFIEQQWVGLGGSGSLTHDISGCPSYPP